MSRAVYMHIYTPNTFIACITEVVLKILTPYVTTNEPAAWDGSFLTNQAPFLRATPTQKWMNFLGSSSHHQSLAHITLPRNRLVWDSSLHVDKEAHAR